MNEANRNTTTSDRLTTVLSYGTLLLLGYLVFLIVAPFLVPLAWSAVLAIFFYPVYQWLQKRMSANVGRRAVHRGSDAGADCAGADGFALCRPGSGRLRGESPTDRSGRGSDGHGEFRGPDPPASASFPARSGFYGAAAAGGGKNGFVLAGSLAGMLKNLLNVFVNLFILLFALFFVFRDGDRIMAAIRHLLPFEKKLQKEMLDESRDLIIASVAVALIIAGIQGFLGGVAFAITGIRAPIFLGVVVAFCSIIPVVGSALVWIPAAGWLAFNGSWGKAIVIFVICGGVAGLADNFVRPLLLRNRTRLNDLLLFISILGGLHVFGLLGLVVGPTIVAAALGVFRVYTDHRDEIEAAEA